MKSTRVLIILVCILGVLLLAGCTDKTKHNPTRFDAQDKGTVWIDAWRFYSIFFSTAGNPGYMNSLAYLPPGYNWQSGSGRPYPVLYLLSPFRGDDRYYFEHGLAEVADRLLAEGKIQPMIVVSIDGRSLLGGSFYANSPIQGDFFSALVEDKDFLVNLYINRFEVPAFRGERRLESPALVNRYDDLYRTIADPEARAISGVGMGGYGAFAAALQTNLFGSVSAIDAPLDFDGIDGNTGFLSLFRNTFTPGAWTRIDTTETGRVDTTFIVDTSQSNQAMSLIVSAAAAFSPHYLATRTDSVYWNQLQLETWAYTVTDSVVGSPSTYLRRHKAHVPFDSTGAIVQPIWDKWLEKSIPSLYSNDTLGYAAAFDTMPKLLISSDYPEFYYNEQMAGCIDFLTENGITFDTMSFSGNGALTGTADHFLYDLLEDILIFHSKHFVIPPDIEGR